MTETTTSTVFAAASPAPTQPLAWPLAYWERSAVGNFGDELTPWLLARLTGREPVYVGLDCPWPKMVMSGSILSRCDGNCVVWGAGIANRDDAPAAQPDIRAVRGPLSRDACLRAGLACPEVYGDPALLLPRFISDPGRRLYPLGIVPHYTDHVLAAWLFDGREDLRLIDVAAGVEAAVAGILECRAILASSLHGLIVADAYGIPARRCRFGNRVLGDGTKYRDHWHATGRRDEDDPGPLDVRALVLAGQAKTAALAHQVTGHGRWTAAVFDPRPLWDACPIPVSAIP